MKRHDRITARSAIVTILALFLPATVAAQTQVASGAVTRNGIPQADLEVMIVDDTTKEELKRRTDTKGRFSFLAADTGTYTITAFGPNGEVTKTLDAQTILQYKLDGGGVFIIDIGGPVPPDDPKPIVRSFVSSSSHFRVTRQRFQDGAALNSWLATQRNRVIIAIVDGGSQGMLFIDRPLKATAQPVYIVVPINEELDGTKLERHLDARRADAFVGIYSTSLNSYLIVFRNDAQ